MAKPRNRSTQCRRVSSFSGSIYLIMAILQTTPLSPVLVAVQTI